MPAWRDAKPRAEASGRRHDAAQLAYDGALRVGAAVHLDRIAQNLDRAFDRLRGGARAVREREAQLLRDVLAQHAVVDQQLERELLLFELGAHLEVEVRRARRRRRGGGRHGSGDGRRALERRGLQLAELEAALVDEDPRPREVSQRRPDAQRLSLADVAHVHAQAHAFALLHQAVLVAAGVVEDLIAVREQRAGQAEHLDASLAGRDVGARGVGEVRLDHVDAAQRLTRHGDGQSSHALLPRLHLADEDLALVEQGVWRLRDSADAECGRRAAVLDGERKRERLAGAHVPVARVRRAGRERGQKRRRRRVRWRLRPVDADLRERLLELRGLLDQTPVEERTRRGEDRAAAGELGCLTPSDGTCLRQQIARETNFRVLNEVLGLRRVLALLRVGHVLCLAPPLRRRFQIVDGLDRTIGRAHALRAHRLALLEILLARRAARLGVPAERLALLDPDGLGHQVGRDAHLLDRDVARREVLRDRELERGAVVVVVEHLHGALAEGRAADDHGAVEVLERAGDDLRGAGAALVDEHRHRHRLGRFTVGLGALGLALLASHTDGGDDGAVVDEDVGDLDGLIEQPARIAAQVQQDGLCALLAQLRQRVDQVIGGVALEVLDRHVGDVALEQARLDASNRDAIAREHVALRDRGGALDPDHHLGLGLATQARDGLGERHVDGRFVVDLGDAIAALEAGARGGRRLDRLDDGEMALADADHDAEAAELAAGREAHLVVDLGLEQLRVRVERREQAVDRGVFDGAHVAALVHVLLDEREDLLELARERPRAVDARDVEVFGGIVDAHGDGAAARLLVDHHLGDATLHVVEGREQHLLGVEAGRIDVVLLHAVQRELEDLQAAEIVVRGVGGGGERAGTERDGRPFAPPRDGEQQRRRGGEEDQQRLGVAPYH